MAEKFHIFARTSFRELPTLRSSITCECLTCKKGGTEKKRGEMNGGNGARKPGAAERLASVWINNPLLKRKEDFMNKQLRLLGSFGLLSLLLMGTAISSAYANGKCNPKSPTRGTWSFSQSTQTFFDPLSIFSPGTEVGTFTNDECGHTVGHGIFNDALGSLEFDFTGDCVFRADGLTMDCTLQSGSETNNVVCTMMEKQGECFQEYRCVSTRPYGTAGPVLLAELKRVRYGTCK